MGNWLWGPKAEVQEPVTVQDGAVYNRPQLSGVNVRGNIYMNVTAGQAPARSESNVPPTATDPALNRESNGSPEDKLLSILSEFAKRVSEPVLKQLLDRLLQQGVIDQEEMETLRSHKPKSEVARAVILMVRGKGPEASSFLIQELVSLDRTVSRTLGLI